MFLPSHFFFLPRLRSKCKYWFLSIINRKVSTALDWRWSGSQVGRTDCGLQERTPRGRGRLRTTIQPNCCSSICSHLEEKLQLSFEREYHLFQVRSLRCTFQKEAALYNFPPRANLEDELKGTEVGQLASVSSRLSMMVMKDLLLQKSSSGLA